VLFLPGGAEQSVAEGFVVGLVHLCCAACIIIMARASVIVKPPQHAAILIAVGIAVFAVTFTRLLSIYRYKNPWYGSSSL
jgi:hypothetical protein